MYYNNNTVLYLDGSFVPATMANTSLYSQTLHYGYGVFEGIRSYNTPEGVQIFKCREHYERLQRSAALIGIPFNYEVDELMAISEELLRLNKLEDAYLRPLVFCDANMSLTKPNKVSILIAAWEWGAYLGEQQLRLKLSSFCRPHPRSVQIEAKVCGHYVNSILATNEAKDNGFDEALLLDTEGFLAEGPGANLFFEKHGILYTPQLGNILPGITRTTVIELALALGMKVVEGQFTMLELQQADHAFYCGTAAEIIAIKSVDNFVFTKGWSLSLGYKLQQAYSDLVRGSLTLEKDDERVK